jgi:D-alanyl-D-alanine carboxypeptidase
MKTGFTCRAGYNLVGSVRRAQRHLVGVVMGAPSADARARTMRELMDRALAGHRDPGLDQGLEELGRHAGRDDALPMSGNIIARACLEPGGRRQGPLRWTIDVGVERSYSAASKAARSFIQGWRPRLSGARAMVIPRYTGVDLFRAGVTGLSKEVARDTCLAFRKKGGDCIIMDTPAATAQLERARQVRRLSKLNAASMGAGGSR